MDSGYRGAVRGSNYTQKCRWLSSFALLGNASETCRRGRPFDRAARGDSLSAFGVSRPGSDSCLLPKSAPSHGQGQRTQQSSKVSCCCWFHVLPSIVKLLLTGKAFFRRLRTAPLREFLGKRSNQ